MRLNTELPADTLISCFSDSHDCVKVINTDALILSFNDHGYTAMEIDNPKDVLGKDWLSFWDGDVKEQAQQAFDDATRGKFGSFQGYCPTMKGTPKWWDVVVVPLQNNFGMIEWILAISRDVTELHDLREENKQLRATAAK